MRPEEVSARRRPDRTTVAGAWPILEDEREAAHPPETFNREILTRRTHAGHTKEIHMKRLMAVLAVTLLIGAFFASRVFADTADGAPSGPHYDLNIHGIAHGGSASTTCTCGLVPGTAGQH